MEKNKTSAKKYGKAIIIGRPNTGKSTLINTIMSQKVSITSPLPQTTRRNIPVIYKDERGEIYFVDTPGLVANVKDLIGKRVNTEASKSIGKTDVIVMVVDISREKNEEENKVIGLVRRSKAKKILVYNKIDKAVGSKDHLAEYNYLEEEFDKVIGISAIKGKNVKGLIKLIFDLIPARKKRIDWGDDFNVEDSKPVIPMESKEYVGEIIREKAYLFLREEVPYSLTVNVDEIQEKKDIIVIKASIITTADRYKKMIIGRGGRKIKEIGYNARKELELMSQRKIFLDLTVIVDRHWPERIVER
jgi:GTP-binding protein Era